MTTTLPDALERLQTALDDLATALVSGDAGEVLSKEVPLASAVKDLTACRSAGVETSNGDRLRAALAGTRTSLLRCRSLGSSANAYARATFPQATYGRRDSRLVNGGDSRRLTSIT